MSPLPLLQYPQIYMVRLCEMALKAIQDMRFNNSSLSSIEAAIQLRVYVQIAKLPLRSPNLHNWTAMGAP
jgi:hypothetical protein